MVERETGEASRVSRPAKRNCERNLRPFSGFSGGRMVAFNLIWWFLVAERRIVVKIAVFTISPPSPHSEGLRSVRFSFRLVSGFSQSLKLVSQVQLSSKKAVCLKFLRFLRQSQRGCHFRVPRLPCNVGRRRISDQPPRSSGRRSFLGSHNGHGRRPYSGSHSRVGLHEFRGSLICKGGRWLNGSRLGEGSRYHTGSRPF